MFGAVLQPETSKSPPQSLRTYAEHQRPVSANPLDMRPPWTPYRPLRAQGPRPPDLLTLTPSSCLLAELDALEVGAWPLDQPRAATAQPRKLRGRSGEAVVAGPDRMRVLLTDSSTYTEPPPPPPQLMRNRAAEYSLNARRCSGTSWDLMASPLYEVRPGTAADVARPREW